MADTLSALRLPEVEVQSVEGSPLNGMTGPDGERRQVVILIPLYNDWSACRLLLSALGRTLGKTARACRVMLVDDGSTQPAPGDFPGPIPGVLGRVDVIRLRGNLGHQRAIAIGLSYIWEHVPCETIVLMDSDGEDDPADVPRLLAKYDEESGRKIIFAERTRRSESWTFVAFYRLYRMLHRLLVGMGVRVGNFSAIPRSRLESLVVVSELWNHYAAAVVKSRQPFETVPTRRADRLAGKSRMDFVALVAHGLGAISVFGDVIGVRLLVATMVLIGLTIVGLVATVVLRLATDLPIPGWATSTFGILTVILFQAVMLSIQFSFIVLGGRQGTSFLPCRDYAYYVAEFRELPKVDDPIKASTSGSASWPP